MNISRTATYPLHWGRAPPSSTASFVSSRSNGICTSLSAGILYRPCMPRTDPLDCLHHVLHLIGHHLGKQRQTDNALPQGGSKREILRTPAIGVLVIRMKMQRSPVNGTAHSSLFELGDERVAIDG